MRDKSITAKYTMMTDFSISQHNSPEIKTHTLLRISDLHESRSVETNKRVSNSTVSPLASVILSGGARSLSLKFKMRSKTVGYTIHGGAKRSSIC